MTLGQTLTSVRNQRHFSLAAVSLSSGISETSLSQFESDKKRPTYIQLTKLANTYGVAPYVFAEETLPNLPELVPDFRQNKLGPARLSPDGMKRIWAVESRAHFTRQLQVAVKYKPANLSGNELPAATVDYAHSLRTQFDMWHTHRAVKFGFAGAEDQKTLAALRLFFEVQGVLVNINSAPEADYTGFYLQPERASPAIFVNRKIYSKKAQLFTICHEYAHHLIGEEGVSDPFVSVNAIERRCNRFAAEFLSPEEGISKIVKSLPAATLAEPNALIRAVSRRSLLSLHATAIRLVELAYINQYQLSRWLAEYFRFPKVEKDAEDEVGGGAVHAKRIGEVGYLPTYLSKVAVDQKIIDRRDVVDGLALAESLQLAAFDLAARRVDVAVS